MRSLAIIVTKICIALAFVAFLFYWSMTQELSWNTLISAWGAINGVSLVAIFLLIILSHIVRGMRVHRAYLYTFKRPLCQVLSVSAVHNTMSFLLPMRLGEVFLPLLSRKKLNIPVSYSTASLLILRALDVHYLLLLITIWGYFSHGNHYFGALSLIILVVSIPILFIILRYLSTRYDALVIIQALLKNRRGLLSLYAYTVCIWTTKLLALSYLVTSLSHIDHLHAFIAVLFADASVLSPITGFANAGTFEAAFALPLAPFDYAGIDMLKMALNLHLFVLFTNLVVGACGALSLRFNRT